MVDPGCRPGIVGVLSGWCRGVLVMIGNNRRCWTNPHPTISREVRFPAIWQIRSLPGCFSLLETAPYPETLSQIRIDVAALLAAAAAMIRRFFLG